MTKADDVDMILAMKLGLEETLSMERRREFHMGGDVTKVEFHFFEVVMNQIFDLDSFTRNVTRLKEWKT